MPYVKVEKGNTMNSSEMNANFQHVGQGNWLPMGGQGLANTTGVYNLGSDVYRIKTLFINSIPSITTFDNTWYRISTVELSVTSSSIEFTGLNGDNDIMYQLITRIRGQMDVPSLTNFELLFNSDSGTNYGYIFFAGWRTDPPFVWQTTASKYIILGSLRSATVSLNFSKFLIYAKTGYERICLGNSLDEAVSTSGAAIITTVKKIAGIWNNTAATITSLKIRTNGFFSPDTFIDLWARR